VPPEQVRLLFLRPRPQQAIEFDPLGTDAIPRLFDEFDRLAAATAGREVRGELPAGYEAIFRYSLLDTKADVRAEAEAFRPAFGHLTLLVQLPNVDVAARVEAEKGSPLSDREREILDERVRAARAWLDSYAPESARIEVRREAVPAAAGELDHGQRDFLARLSREGEVAQPSTGDGWQALIFDVARSIDLPARRAFEAVYRAFLGRTNGPRAGWLLASLEPEFVVARAWEASGWTAAGPGADPIPVGG
jgi:lysyl-tRNA synthetase class 1